MRNDLAEIVMVIDRSGSMASCRSDAEGGVNQFIADQKAQPGSAHLTLVQFDTEYEFVHKGDDIQSVGTYTLKPRGSTALLDAMGRAINETGARLAALPEEMRPGLVTVVVVTDGQENSSKEYTFDKVKAMVEHQQAKYNWRFVFLGTDPMAVASAVHMGMPVASAAVFNQANIVRSMDVVSKKMSDARAFCSAGFGEAYVYNFDDNDRASMADPVKDNA